MVLALKVTEVFANVVNVTVHQRVNSTRHLVITLVTGYRRFIDQTFTFSTFPRDSQKPNVLRDRCMVTDDCPGGPRWR